MAIDEVFGQPWTRKHDDPAIPTVPAAPATMFPKSLANLIFACATRDPAQRMTAAGSHWALSTAAIADHTFIETHDPRNVEQAMGKTLFDVVPGCLSDQILDELASSTPAFDPANFTENFGKYFVHFETGKRVYQLYAELDHGDDDNPASLAAFMRDQRHNSSYLGPWAFETMGGAGGQTVFGALTTGTHGGDFRFPPMADAAMAMHLVADGGRHYWIERTSHLFPGPFTDDAKLKALFDKDELKGREKTAAENFHIIRDDDVFHSVLIGAGRFGIVYSVVLRVVRQYSLHEQRSLGATPATVWKGIKAQITNIDSDLFKIVPLPDDEKLFTTRFLQIAVSVTPHGNFGSNLVGVTKRWNVPIAIDPSTGQPSGRQERVGALVVPFDPSIQAPRFVAAGRSHPYAVDKNLPGAAASPSFLDLACMNASFLQGAVGQVIGELEDFVASNGTVIGAILGSSIAVGGGSMIAILPALLAILATLLAFLDWLASLSDPRLGQSMNHLREMLLADPATRAAGILAWQMISFKVFSDQQEPHDIDALSYAIMDGHDYLDQSCFINVDSIEVFFDATDDIVVTFVDQILAFEVAQENLGRAFVGYISLRFTGETRALIGEERHARNCVVEIAGLKDVSGVRELIDFAIATALDPNFGGILHWGQRNESNQQQIEARFGDTTVLPTGDLHTWRSTLSHLTLNGKLDGFSNSFTRATGLEIVTPRIEKFEILGDKPQVGDSYVLGWRADLNPPETVVTLFAVTPGGTFVITGQALVGHHSMPPAITGQYHCTLTATINPGNEQRTVDKTVIFTVS